MLASEPELASRVTAAIRVGGRRWNLRIDDVIDVLLPEEGAETAWSRLAELERASALLKRDLQAVDLRLPDRLGLRAHGAPAHQAPPAHKPHSGGKAA